MHLRGSKTTALWPRDLACRCGMRPAGSLHEEVVVVCGFLTLQGPGRPPSLVLLHPVALSCCSQIFAKFQVPWPHPNWLYTLAYPDHDPVRCNVVVQDFPEAAVELCLKGEAHKANCLARSVARRLLCCSRCCWWPLPLPLLLQLLPLLQLLLSLASRLSSCTTSTSHPCRTGAQDCLN
mgnify:CR=1 FL=1